jgi:hypothetical protein
LDDDDDDADGDVDNPEHTRQQKHECEEERIKHTRAPRNDLKLQGSSPGNRIYILDDDDDDEDGQVDNPENTRQQKHDCEEKRIKHAHAPRKKARTYDSSEVYKTDSDGAHRHLEDSEAESVDYYDPDPEGPFDIEEAPRRATAR